MYTHDVAKTIVLWMHMQDCFAFLPESPWGRCLAHFLHTCSRSGSEETRREYTRTLSLLFSETQKAPDDITQEDVLSFIHSPSRSPRNPGAMPTAGTVNTRLAIIKAFYMFASTYTVTGPDGHPAHILQRAPPTIGIKTSKPDVQAKVFTFEELQKLFAVIPPDVRGLRDKALFLCLFWTCRRRSEIANLRFGDIERATIVDERGERREGFLYRFRNKGDTVMDSAELPWPAKRAIDRYLLASGRIHTIQSSDPLWVPTDMTDKIAYDQSMPLTSTTISRRLKLYCRKAGIPSDFSIHSFRHTGARARYEAGSDIREIQRLLRHKNLSVTDLYLRRLTGTSDPGYRLLEAKYGHL